MKGEEGEGIERGRKAGRGEGVNKDRYMLVPCILLGQGEKLLT